MVSLDRQQAFSGTKEAAPALRIDAGQDRPGGRQGVDRHALRTAREGRLRDPDAAVHRLDRADVEVLARVAGCHHGELRGGEVELLDAAGTEERHQPERLDTDMACG